jgi:predicted phosphodiesterase
MRSLPLRRCHAVIALWTVLTAAQGCAGQIAPLAQRAPSVIPTAAHVRLPLRDGSARFAAIGDTGTGGSGQYRVAGQLSAAHAKFPFEFVLMMGDNMYGSERAEDYVDKFERPYKPLLDAGVKFYASLGNHDGTNQIFYQRFNMGGKRFYTFKPGDDLRFFALDSTYMSPEQLEWLEKELSASGSEWKIAFFHHPLYSEGHHGSDLQLRQELEPLFLKHGVDVVFTGHEHFYERLKPQKGIHYFIAGGSAKLRRGDIDRSAPIHAAGFDQGYSFMVIEIVADEMHFQAISDQGKTVDSGVIQRRERSEG